LRKRENSGKLKGMEEQYAECTKEELIRIILDQNRTIEELKKEIEGLKHPVRKDSTNSSIPTSKEPIPRTRRRAQKRVERKPGASQDTQVIIESAMLSQTRS
jgi:hypothetical protein